jgi:Carboxypeptidase regulatory-like domain/TonB dependent receptor
MMKSMGFAGFLCILAGVGVPLCAQTYGEINGTVSDPSGAVVAAAMVTVTNSATNASRTAATNETGHYAIPFLVPGSYSIRAEQQGFKRAVRTGVELEVNAAARIDFTLEVGGVAETVEVSGAASMLATEGASVGTVIENRRIVELPLNGRNYLQLITLSPNVSAETVPSGTGGLRQGGERANQTISIAGQRLVFIHYTLDGVENTDPNFNTFVIRPSIDALQEFKVESGIYSAEFGRQIGQVNVTTKSGSNALHGTLFEFVRNDALNARDWLQSTGVKNPFHRNQFGYTLGGRIKKDRLFFMSNFETLRETRATQSVASVATDRMRSGDFSKAGRTIYDPLSRVFTTDAKGNPLAVSALPFNGNIIPANRFHPVDVGLLQFYPRATVPGDTITSNYVREGGHATTWEQFTQRFDFVENTKSFWFGRYGWGDEEAPQFSTFAETEGRYLTTVNQAMLANTRIISSTIVNEFRFGYTQFRNDQLTHSAYVTDVIKNLGIQNVPLPPPVGWGVPTITLANGLAGFGETVDGPFINRNHIFDFVDNMSVTHGAHSIKFGAQYRRDRMNQLGNAYPRGQYTFSVGSATFNPASRLNTGYSFADFLLGQAQSAQLSAGLSNLLLRGNAYSFYVEDTWKVAPKWTVNFGLRYEITNPYHDKYRGFMNLQFFDPGVGPNGILAGTKTPVLVRPGAGGVYDGTTARFWDQVPTAAGSNILPGGDATVLTDRNDFAPRIGLAYSPSSKWTFRAGLGVFYAHDILNGSIDELARNLNGRAQLAANTEVPNIDMSDPLKADRLAAKCTGWSGVCQSNGTLALAMDSHIRTPYVTQWLFNMQHQFAKDLVLEVGYLGNEGHKLERQHILNVPMLRTGASDASTTAQRSPWPAWGRIQLIDGPLNSNYHALSGKLSQRFATGLTYMASFTWSKAIDYGSAIRPGGSEGGSAINSYDFTRERGLAAYNVPRRFVGSILYELPFGQGRKFLHSNAIADKIVGGWQLSSILTLADGIPWSIGTIGDTLNIGSNNAPDATGISPVPANQTPQQFWNIAAFSSTNPQLAFRFGNVGRNVLSSPGVKQWDFSLIKNTRITERQSLQLRFEAFNFANHPNWNTPPANITAPATFGIITSAKDMRQMQVGLKYSF